MPQVTDQTGRTIHVPAVPQRIVSLVPSQTELLAGLGLEDEVVGITKFCIHPERWFRSKTRVGGTKTLNFEKLTALQPDLVLANKEENVREQVEAIAQQFPVWVSDVNSVPEALDMITAVGALTGRQAPAAVLSADIKSRFEALPQPAQTIRTAYLIWKDPYMTVGGDSFIHDVLRRAGFANVFAHKPRYPAISLHDLQAASPELLLLSSEPYPFKPTHLAELQVQLPNTQVLLVDGEAFSWYGSRLLHTPAYLSELWKQIGDRL